MAEEQMKKQGHTSITLKNKTPTAMTLGRYHNWSGSANCLPNGIGAGNEVQITHLKDRFGSKAALQFNGMNAKGVHCAWLLAWDAPTHKLPVISNKVFVICGAKEAIDAIPLDTIVFPPAGTDKAAFLDPFTQTKIEASIDQNPDVATLLGSFGLV